MSQHRSLKGSSSVGAKRNVLKRFERVKMLQADGKWKDSNSPIGLPKQNHSNNTLLVFVICPLQANPPESTDS